MKHGHNDKVKTKISDMTSGAEPHSDQQAPEKIGILTRFLTWIANGAKNSCVT